MRPGLIASLIVHACIFILLFVGLPAFQPKKDYEEHVITVQVLPVSAITNVKQKHEKPKTDPKKEILTKNTPKPSMPDPQKPRPKDEVKVEPLPKQIVKKEEPKKEAIKPKPDAKPQPKTEEKKPETKKPAKPKVSEDSFAAAVKSVEEFKKKEDKKTDKKQEKDEEEDKDDLQDVEDALATANKSEYKEGLPMSLSEKDAIRQQIMKNWTVPAGAKDIQKMSVKLHIMVQPDGTISKVDVSGGNGNAALQESAVRAVYKSSPLKDLPAEKYDVKDGWKEMEMNFSPSEMVN